MNRHTASLKIMKDNDSKFEKEQEKADKKELRKWFKEEKSLDKAFRKGKKRIEKDYPKFYD